MEKVTLEHRAENMTLFSQIFEKCYENREFKNYFINNPKKALEEFKGKKLTLPEWKNKIKVEDQTDSSIIYLNIPAPEELNVELTEEELSFINGGVACGGVCVGLIIVAAGAVVGWLAE